MIERIIGVFRLDAGTFEQVEHDESAMSQAAMIVLAVAVASGIGGLIGALIGDGNAIMAFVGSVIAAFVGWLVWSAAVYFVGTSFFEGQADMGEMLRVVGFAYAPQLLGIFVFIPCIGWLISLAGWVWSLAAMVVAIREGLDVDTGKAIITAIIGWVVVVVLNIVVGMIFGGLAFAGSALAG